MRVQDDAATSRPKQTGFFQSGGTRTRLRWRAVVHAGRTTDTPGGQQTVAWHLADCDDPPRPEAHCDLGRHLLASDGNPDGHCRVAGACPRCLEDAHPDGQT